MKRLLDSISFRLEQLRDGKLSQTEVDMLVDEQLMLLRILFFDSHDGMMVIEESGRCYAVNRAQMAMLGYSRDELLNMYSWDWDAQFDKEAILAMTDRNDSQGFRFESLHRRKDGTVFPVEVSTNAVVYNGQKLSFCVTRDMTESKNREAMIRHLAITDGLTGLVNRREFTRNLLQEIERAERYNQGFSLLMYDLDFFKSINDGYGHDVGDTVLVKLTQLLQSEIRQTDIQARWGGEEFMILLPGINLYDAERFSEKLRKLVEEYQFNSHHGVTISIGVVQYHVGESIDSLLKRVDDALYKAKSRGRNCVVAG